MPEPTPRETPDKAAAIARTPPPAHATAKLGIGMALIAATFLLGACAQLAAVTRWGLHIDQTIADHYRAPARTAVATVLTRIATPEIVGIGAIILLPLAFVLARRRSDALQILCIVAGTLAAALVAKLLIAENRPPAALWAIPADSGASYPSGHTAVAAAVVVALVVVARNRAWRTVALTVGAVYTLAVAASRIYLANHYPPDVIGSILCALAAGFIVTGLAKLRPIRPHLARLDGHRNEEPAL